MSSVGPISSDLARLVAALDPRKLVDLCADYLSTQGHTNIRITDGPGDAGRDIHSIDRDGNKFLTQCKFHKDLQVSATSSDIDDLVRGMSKFGYDHGLFATNAKLSPQAKREILSDYPRYQLQFLDGASLVREVHANAVLNALWLDRDRIDRVKFSLLIPVIVRELQIDIPVMIKAEKANENEFFERISVGRSVVQANFYTHPIPSEDFEPYRIPRSKSFFESGHSTINTVRIVLSGAIALNDIHAICRTIGEEVLKRVNELAEPQKHRSHIAIRVGRPSFSILSGPSPGALLRFDSYLPFTLVRHAECITDEWEWLLPGSTWIAPAGFPTSASDQVRWYNPERDMCLDLALLSSPSATSRKHLELNREAEILNWMSSAFSLTDIKALNRLEERGLPPCFCHAWKDGQYFCGWILAVFGKFISLPLTSEFLMQESEPGNLELMKREALQQMEGLRRTLLDLGATLLPPESARHMKAFLDCDPFRSNDLVQCRSVDIIRDPDNHHDAIEAAWDAGPQTLIHGDAHIGNLFLDGERVGFLDWGMAKVGTPVRDVTFFLTMGVEPADRRREERALIQHYLDARRALGGTPIAFEGAWLAHRVHAAYTVIASFLSLVPPYNTEARRLFTSHFRARAMAAIEDLDSVGALREVGIAGA